MVDAIQAGIVTESTKQRLNELEATKNNLEASIAKEEIKAQKRELAEEYKRLEKKREETPFVETKKEITKQIDKIADEFDKLTYEEMKEFVKPESVEAEEIKEAEKIEEEKQILDSNETPQMEDIEEIDEKKEKVESDYEKWDRKQDEMAKDPNITIKSTINEIESIEPWIKWELEERYWEKWDKEESYSDSDIDSITDKLEKSLIERDKKFRKEQREKTKDMESSTITKEQQSQLDKAKTKEEKEKLLDKRRKEYIERNPIAEEYLKEAENHQNERQRRFDLIDKWRAISRRLMNKRHEEENRRREEQRRKIQEQKNAEEKSKRETYDLLWENETPQIDEKPQVVSSEKTPEWEKETKNEQVSKPQSKQLVDVSKDGTVNKEPMVWEYTSKEIQDRIDFLKQKRLDNWKKLYAQDLAELTTLQDLLPRQKERESRPEWTTELSDRQREILNSNNYGDVYTESKSD